MRLIDADALFRAIKNSDWLPHERIEAMKMVREQPTIDAVPVVRCKDSKNYRLFKNRFGVEISRCMFIGADVGNEAFCSYGERKDGEG